MTPPRKAARGRENDNLLALLTLSGPTGITAESLQVWLKKKGEEYYRISGTVTFAMRTLVDSINNELLDRNLKKARDGAQLDATLNLAVQKRDNLYLVNIGSTSTFFANEDESVVITDSENQGRGLGVNQMVQCHFVHKEIHEGDTVLFAALPSPSWSAESFAGSTKLSVEALSRRLYNQAGTDLRAAMVRFTSGRGVVMQNSLPRISGNPRSAEPVLLTEDAGITKTILKTTASGESGQREAGELRRDAVQTDGNGAKTARVPLEAALHQQKKGLPFPLKKTNATAGHPALQKGSSPVSRVIKAKTGKIFEKTGSIFSLFWSSISGFFQKTLPGLADEPLKLSRSALIAIAVIVPVLIVIIAGTVYVRTGKTQQFDLYMIQAQSYGVQSDGLAADTPLQIASLQQALFWLDKAESYGQSDASVALRAKVQGTLDAMQGVERLEMKPVVAGGIPGEANISQIITTATDLYFLDDVSGKILRYYMSGSGYQSDPAFDCGPNPENLLNPMGKLVDMVPVNVNNSFRASLLAVDGAGNIEFCIPNESGVSGSLPPPDQGWKQLKAISLFNNYLYVLDAAGNAVYRYQGENYQFSESPTLFFDEQIPRLIDAMEIEVNVDELYILRSGGQMVECTYSHMKDYKLTECIDPAPFGDMRTGQVPQPIAFPEAQFLQMRMTMAPDSSIYLLDGREKTIFHFSLQRNLQKILHPRLSDGLNLDKLTPTAFAISSGRLAFLAYGNQVYYAPLP